MTFPYSKPIVIVDVETTGGSPESNYLIEIGIIRIENGREVSRFQSLINPGQSVPIFVQRLTGISDQDLVTAPRFEAIADEVEAQLQGALFIGHNVRFDYDFIRHEFRRLSRRYFAETLCSARLSRALFPDYKRHNLSEIIERHGLSVSSRHRALDDAQAVWDFFKKSTQVVGADRFRDVFEKLVAGRPVETRIPAERFQNVPEAPGCYLFRGEKNEVLYVGKSSNLRERILGHFYGDFENARDEQLLQQARDMEWIRAPGELSALFLETELNEKWKPVFSKKAKLPGGMVCAVKNDEAHYLPWIQLLPEREILDKKNALGFYRGFREAKQALLNIAEKNKICRKVLGLERGEGPCSGVRLGQCDGVCGDPSNAAEHLKKAERAFQNSGAVAWPFQGTVVIDERESESSDEGEAYVVRNWLLMARIRYQGAARRIFKIQQGFDRDQFKILKKIIQSGLPQVRELKESEYQTLMKEAVF